ncbi:MAG TPA: hydroxymethylpyrimidine/phosphomethylpyrimidine kinase, partial [Thauera sp.]|nr:hydroxymethylpyrimidine/phosphomethylpyrimidine kinase [Thauera sp.]
LVADRHELCRLAGVVDSEPGEEDEDGEGGSGDDEDGADPAADDPGIEEALARLLGGGTEYILLTGGGEHGPQVVNTLFGHDGVVRTDAWPRLPGRHLGAGTTLTAAAVAAIAHGMALPEAVREAQEFTQQALRHAYRAGMGRALPDRFFWARGKGDGDV